ncbi:MAG: hypothetical protein AABY14_04655, partial [Nanoarchaeota archaeon]
IYDMQGNVISYYPNNEKYGFPFYYPKKDSELGAGAFSKNDLTCENISVSLQGAAAPLIEQVMDKLYK